MKLIFAVIAASALASVAAEAQQASPRPIKRDSVLARAARQFGELDTNKDGTLDKAEMQAAIEVAVAKLRARMQARFDEADVRKAGQISKEEFVAARESWFASVDTNGDGIIDQSELRAYAKSRRGK